MSCPIPLTTTALGGPATIANQVKVNAGKLILVFVYVCLHEHLPFTYLLNTAGEQKDTRPLSTHLIDSGHRPSPKKTSSAPGRRAVWDRRVGHYRVILEGPVSV